MRVVNPLNKTPMSSETMVNGGCHCVCTSGRNVSYAAAWLPVVPNCQCSCGGGTTNEMVTTSWHTMQHTSADIL